MFRDGRYQLRSTFTFPAELPTEVGSRLLYDWRTYSAVRGFTTTISVSPTFIPRIVILVSPGHVIKLYSQNSLDEKERVFGFVYCVFELQTRDMFMPAVFFRMRHANYWWMDSVFCVFYLLRWAMLDTSECDVSTYILVDEVVLLFRWSFIVAFIWLFSATGYFLTSVASE